MLVVNLIAKPVTAYHIARLPPMRQTGVGCAQIRVRRLQEKSSDGTDTGKGGACLHLSSTTGEVRALVAASWLRDVVGGRSSADNGALATSGAGGSCSSRREESIRGVACWVDVGSGGSLGLVLDWAVDDSRGASRDGQDSGGRGGDSDLLGSGVGKSGAGKGKDSGDGGELHFCCGGVFGLVGFGWCGGGGWLLKEWMSWLIKD